MINYIEELDRLASQGEGGGDPPSKQLRDGTVLFQYKEKNAAGQDVYVWKDKSGKKYGGGSIDENAAWAKAQRYSETEAYQPNYDEKKLPAGTYVEQVDQDGETVFTARNISNNQLVGAPAKSVEELYGTSNIGAGNTLPEYEVVAERKPPPMSAGGQNFDWDVRFGDGRTARYNIPAATRGEFDDIIGSNLRPKDQDLGIQRADMVASPMQPRVPGVSPSAGGMQPLAGGSNIANAVLQGAASQSGGAGSIVTGSQGVGTPTKPAPGQQQDRVPRQRGGGGSWSAPGETQAFTQEDFYANTGPLIGQYSTGTEYVATPGRLPMGAISKAATILNNRQVEHDKKRQAFMEELYKPIKTATPYQQNFNQIVRKEQDGFIQSVADAYTGGNISKAHRLVMSNPELRAKWRQKNADLEALGANGERMFDTAVKFMQESAKGTLEYGTPEMRALAKDIVNGLGGFRSATAGEGGDFNKLINDMTQFDSLISRHTYFKNEVVPAVKEFAERLAIGGVDANGRPIPGTYSIDDKGRYMFVNKGHLDTFRGQIDQYARDMAIDMGYGKGNTLEEKVADNRQFLENMLRNRYNMDVTAVDTYRGSSGGGGNRGGGDEETSKYRYGYQKPAALEPLMKPGQKNYWMTLAQKAGAVIPTGYAKDAQGNDIPRYVEEISIGGTTSGEGRPLKPQYINGKYIVPTHVFRDAKGRLYVRGKNSKEPGVKGIDAKGNLISWSPAEVGDYNENTETYSNFERLRDEIIPVAGNEGEIANFLGVSRSELNRMIENKIGASSSSFDEFPD
jgi:hypothetical protein